MIQYSDIDLELDLDGRTEDDTDGQYYGRTDDTMDRTDETTVYLTSTLGRES